MTDIVGNETVRSLWDGLVAACGDRTFLRFRNRADETRAFTYRAFNEEINRAANVFLSLGVKHGERVAVQLCTCPEFMIALFGLAKIGAVMVPMNDQYLAEEADYVLEKTDATCAVIETEVPWALLRTARRGWAPAQGALRCAHERRRRRGCGCGA